MVFSSGNYANKVCLHSLLLLLFSANVAFSGTLVTSIPGFDGDLPFKLYTGYVLMGVDFVGVVLNLPSWNLYTVLLHCFSFLLIFRYITVDKSEMFYYFIESEGNRKEDPVLLWYSGGPGCSAFNGLICEIGMLNWKNMFKV